MYLSIVMLLSLIRTAVNRVTGFPNSSLYVMSLKLPFFITSADGEGYVLITVGLFVTYCNLHFSVPLNVVRPIQVAPFDQSTPNLTQVSIFVVARDPLFCRSKSNNYVPRFRSGPNFEVFITWSILIVQHGDKYWYNLWVTRYFSDTLKYRFRFEFVDRKSSKIETISVIFFNRCSAHDSFNLTSPDMKTTWQITLHESISPCMTSSMASQWHFEYCPLYSCLFCLFVCGHDAAVWPSITTLGPNMYPGCDWKPIILAVNGQITTQPGQKLGQIFK